MKNKTMMTAFMKNKCKQFIQTTMTVKQTDEQMKHIAGDHW